MASKRPLMEIGGWEAFVHGVFAIAITLLVLDIKVPAVETYGTSEQLIHALTTDNFPRYVAYVLGFAFLGTYWIATHRSIRMLRGVDHWGLVIGLVYLMFVSVVPFVTALLAEYIGTDNGRDQVALVVFTGWQLLLSVAAVVSLIWAVRGERLIKHELAGPALDRWVRIAMLGPVIWLVALASAIFLSGTITVILMAVIVIIFLQEAPPFGSPEVSSDGS
ncbi:MAG: TMEM175 family protein [Chloroflexota bacterium]